MKEESNLLIKYSDFFEKQRESAPRNIKTVFIEAMELFIENPLNPHPSLRSHALKGKYLGHFSIDITGNWRAVYKIQKTKAHILIKFRALGTHEQLYGKN